jgi:predicted HTH transcriptional regulator
VSLTTDGVRELLRQPEGMHLEFKSGRDIAKNALRMAPLVAGFANSEGGVLLFGRVDERRGARSSDVTLGVEDVDAALRGIQRLLNAVSPRPDVDVTVHDIDGKKIVAVEVAPGAEAALPRGRIRGAPCG